MTSTTATFRRAMHDCAVRLLDERDHVTVESLAACGINENPEIVEAEREHLLEQAAARIARDILRRLSPDDADPSGRQLSFPGINLPAALCVTSGGDEIYWVRTDKATLAEVEAARAERVQNVRRAQDALDEFDRSLDLLRSVMADRPTMTVGQAVEVLATAV